MNPNQMIYFNALVLQRDFRDEARRSREGEGTEGRPAQARPVRTATEGRSCNFLGLALPGRR